MYAMQNEYDIDMREHNFTDLDEASRAICLNVKKIKSFNAVTLVDNQYGSFCETLLRDRQVF